MNQQVPQTEPERLLREGSRVLGISLRRDAIGKMLRHMELLIRWNSRINLTALRDPAKIAILHFLDSLTVLKVLPSLSGLRILDVGSGAGFPGLVMRTVKDSLRLSLLDRDPKKIVFLKIVAQELGLTDVTFINVALATFLHEHGSQEYDGVVCRAFSPDDAVLDSFHHLLASDGFFIHMAGPSASAGSLRLKHFRSDTVWEGILPFSDRFRRVTLYKRASS